MADIHGMGQDMGVEIHAVEGEAAALEWISRQVVRRLFGGVDRLEVSTGSSCRQD